MGFVSAIWLLFVIWGFRFKNLHCFGHHLLRTQSFILKISLYVVSLSL